MKRSLLIAALLAPLAASTRSLFAPAKVHSNADNQPRRSDFACEQGKIHFQLPGQTLFALTWSAS